MCTPHSFKLQEAVSRAQMARIVDPLEKRDMAVDIIVASPACNQAPVSDKMKRWWADLQRWYGSNLKEAVCWTASGIEPFDRGGRRCLARISVEYLPLHTDLAHRRRAARAIISASKKVRRCADGLSRCRQRRNRGRRPRLRLSFRSYLIMFPRGVRQLLGRGLDGRLGPTVAAHAAAASGLALRRGPWCYLKPKETRPWFSSATVEQAAGASQLAGWQRDRGYNVSAGMEEVRTWPWLCPRPAAPISLKDDVDRAFCDHLEAVDEDLDCDADEADAEFCARLLTPSLRPALDDDNVRAQFRCAARRGGGVASLFLCGFCLRARGRCSRRRRGRACGVCCRSRSTECTPPPPGSKRARR